MLGVGVVVEVKDEMFLLSGLEEVNVIWVKVSGRTKEK